MVLAFQSYHFGEARVLVRPVRVFFPVLAPVRDLGPFARVEPVSRGGRRFGKHPGHHRDAAQASLLNNSRMQKATCFAGGMPGRNQDRTFEDILPRRMAISLVVVWLAVDVSWLRCACVSLPPPFPSPPLFIHSFFDARTTAWSQKQAPSWNRTDSQTPCMHQMSTIRGQR